MSIDTERAAKAAAILDNPLFEESLAVLKEGYTQALMACKPDDDLGRARYAFALRDLTLIKTHLSAVLNRGEIAHHEAKALAAAENVFQRAARSFY